MNILASPSSSVDFLFISSSTLCNLLLEFCPSKEFIVEAGVVNLLSDLTHKSETCLRLNGVWGLMVRTLSDVLRHFFYKTLNVVILPTFVSELSFSCRSSFKSHHHPDTWFRSNFQAFIRPGILC